MFDTLGFLELPIDIRKHIYWHLDDKFTAAQPKHWAADWSEDTLQTAGLTNLNKKQRNIVRHLYPKFAPLLFIFEFDPGLIIQWLEYASWLRYDCIVLDSLRINEVYSGEPMDLVWLHGVKLMLFSDYCMPQVWYTPNEYSKWVSKTTRAKLNMELQPPGKLHKILSWLGVDENWSIIEEVFWGTDTQDRLDTIKFAEQASTLIKLNNDTDSKSPPPLSRNSKTNGDTKMIQDLNLRYETSMEMMLDPDILESAKNLHTLAVRGNDISLLISMGLRDRVPGHLVRRRIHTLKIFQHLFFPPANLTRWNCLQRLELYRIRDLDLNKLILPSSCTQLVIKASSDIKWWSKPRFFNRGLFRSIKPKVNIVNEECVSIVELQSWKAQVWNKWKSLNSVNVDGVLDDELIVPRALWDHGRVYVRCSNIDQPTLFLV